MIYDMAHASSNDSSSASYSSSETGDIPSAISGSFNPFPVKTHTMVLSSKFSPSLNRLSNPATEAAEAGSQNKPSEEANNA